MTRKIVDVAVIIPDASPVLTLARIGRVDLLGSFAAPIKIVDQTLHREGLLPDALDFIEQINSTRRTPMTPYEKVGLTRKVRSTWLRRSLTS